jgi:hypothetical protein
VASIEKALNSQGTDFKMAQAELVPLRLRFVDVPE